MILMRKATPQKLFGVKSLNPHSDSTFAVSKNAAVMEHSRKSPTGCLLYARAARRGLAKGPWSKYWCIVNGPNMIFHQMVGIQLEIDQSFDALRVVAKAPLPISLILF